MSIPDENLTYLTAGALTAVLVSDTVVIVNPSEENQATSMRDENIENATALSSGSQTINDSNVCSIQIINDSNVRLTQECGPANGSNIPYIWSSR